MAEAIGLAASLVGIASAGVSVVSTLTKFGISLRGSNDKINSLAGRVSLTASILSDIATTVEANASGFKKEEFWRTWRKVLQSCEDSYQKLERALMKAKRSGKGKEKGGKDGISAWGKLVWALGGEAEMQDLETSLERCCQQVMMMQQAVQMSVLSLIAQRQKLSSEEIEDQRELMSRLQWLLSTLSEAGVLPTGNSKGKVIVIEEEKPVHVENSSTITPEGGYRSRRRRKEPAGDIGMEGFDSSSSATLQNTPKCFDLEDGGVPLSLDKGFGLGGPSGPSIGLGSFRVHTVLPQPAPRRPTENIKSSARQPPSDENEPLEPKDYFFEAYYIIPRSVPRAQPRGQLQLTKPVPDDYMILCLDTKHDYRKDPNLRNALRRAKRARAVTASAMDDFPQTVREAASSLVSHKKRHANGLNWSLVEGIQLQVLEDSMFKKSFSKSGFLIIFRGSVPQPSTATLPPTSKGDATDPLLQSTRPLKSERHSTGYSNDDVTKKGTLDFQYADLSRNGRPTSRPLPGPVLYSPARTKLMPQPFEDTPGPTYGSNNYPKPSAPAGHAFDRALDHSHRQGIEADHHNLHQQIRRQLLGARQL